MKAKRLISFVLAAAFMLSAAATPVFAAAALPQQTAAVEQENRIVSIRIKATGNLVYGSDYKLEVQTTPADTQYIGVVVGIGGEANGYVTLMLSDKIRTLLKMIPLPKRMSATPDQTTDFNLYSYIKQLIDGNDVEVLLRVADEVASVMDALQFYIPTIKDVSTGLRLALEMIRKYLPESAFTRIYLDEQPVDSLLYSIAMNFAEPKKKPYPFKLIEELAEEGPCIIMGRCAGYLMRNREEAFSVFVHADMETRIERVKERDHITSRMKAKRKIQDVDEKRSAFRKDYTGQEWGMSKNYDLSVSTTELSYEQAADLILYYKLESN